MTADPAAVAVVKSRLEEHETRASECRALLTLMGADPEDQPDPDDGRDADDDGEEAPARVALRHLVPSANGAAKPRRPRADKADTPAGGKVHHKTAARLLRQTAVARFVRDHEPATSGEISSGCSIPLGSLAKLLDSEWFEKTGRNPRDPWRLTDAGRQALERPAG